MPHVLQMKDAGINTCLTQSASKSMFQILKQRICACVLEPFSKGRQTSKNCVFFANHTRLSFPFFFVSLEPHVERPEESVKIANKTSQPGVFLIRIRLLRSKKKKAFYIKVFN